jgi:hypothetical protein
VPTATTIFYSARLAVLSRTKQNHIYTKEVRFSYWHHGKYKLSSRFPFGQTKKLYNTDDLEDKLKRNAIVTAPHHLHFPFS